jgi:hypothetical protein
MMIGITFIIAAIVLLQLTQLPTLYYKSEVPTIFEITNIKHTNEYGVLNYESYMVVKNIGNTAYDNRKLYAKTYRNGELLPCFIPYINFNKFIYVHPYGIKTIGGVGTDNYQWNPGATIFIDYSQGTFHPGDVVRFEVYDRDTNQIISRDTWPHTSDNTQKWLDLLFSHSSS